MIPHFAYTKAVKTAGIKLHNVRFFFFSRFQMSSVQCFYRKNKHKLRFSLKLIFKLLRPFFQSQRFHVLSKGPVADWVIMVNISIWLTLFCCIIMKCTLCDSLSRDNSVNVICTRGNPEIYQWFLLNCAFFLLLEIFSNSTAFAVGLFAFFNSWL